jgi:hypothetical protein
LIAELPVLRTVISPWMPPGHWLVTRQPMPQAAVDPPRSGGDRHRAGALRAVAGGVAAETANVYEVDGLRP